MKGNPQIKREAKELRLKAACIMKIIKNANQDTEGKECLLIQTPKKKTPKNYCPTWGFNYCDKCLFHCVLTVHQYGKSGQELKQRPWNAAIDLSPQLAQSTFLHNSGSPSQGWLCPQRPGPSHINQNSIPQTFFVLCSDSL